MKNLLLNVAGGALIIGSLAGAVINYGDGPMNHPAFLPMTLVLYAIIISVEIRDRRRYRRFRREMDEKWRKLREGKEDPMSI